MAVFFSALPSLLDQRLLLVPRASQEDRDISPGRMHAHFHSRGERREREREGRRESESELDEKKQE